MTNIFSMLLYWLAIFKGCSATVTSEQATDTIKIIRNGQSDEIVISWNDTDSSGTDFTTFEWVRISYQDAEDGSAIPKTLSDVPQGDHGVNVPIDPSIFYIFWIKYINSAEVACLPILVGLNYNENVDREGGIFDLLLKVPPTLTWKYNGDGWNNLDNRIEMLIGLSTGLDENEFLSPFAFSRKYYTYVYGMRNGETILWDTLPQPGIFRDLISRIWYFENPSNYMKQYLPTSGDPDLYSFAQNHYHHHDSFGYSIRDSVRYGAWLHRDRWNHFYYGLGLSVPPYVGLWEDHKDRKWPMVGYVLGERSSAFIKSTSFKHYLPECGNGVTVYTHDCEISYEPWKDVFCPPQDNETLIEKECPFDTPSNLHIEAFERTSITVKWDLYNTSTLHAEQNFKITLKAFDANNDVIQTQDRSRSNTHYQFSNLQPFSNYTFSIAGYSSMGNIEGNYSELVYGRTKQGVPNGTPTFISATPLNSTCISLKWEHINEVNVVGILRSYELRYHLEGAPGAEITKEIGVVTDYLVCNLLHYQYYHFELRARNDDELANLAATTDNRTGEYIPESAPTELFTEESSNTSILITWSPIATTEWNGSPYLYYIFYRLNGTNTYDNITVQEYTNKVNVTGLESYTLYDLQVAAATVVGIGPRSDIVTQRSGEHLPLSPPLNITGTDVNETTITVQWVEVPELLRKGIIIGYNVTCYTSNLSEVVQILEVNGSQLTTNIYNLTVFTWYAVTITAFTSVGAGPESNVTFIQSGIGAPDGYPLNFEGYNKSSISLFIRWDNVSIYEWNGAADGFTIQIWPKDISTNVTRNYDRETTSALITNLQKFMEYFIEIQCYNEKGSGPKSPIISITTDQSTPLKFDKNVWGSHTGSYSIQVKWQMLTSDRKWLGYPYEYHVYYRRLGKLDFTNFTIVEATETEADINGLEGFRVYEVAVAAATVYGPGPYSNLVTIKTGEAAPTGPPQNLTGTYNDSRSIYVNWTEVIEEDTRGFITKYLVICTTKDLVEKGRINISSNLPLTTIFCGLEIYSPYLVTVAAYTAIGLGPATEPVEVWTDAEAPFRGPYNLTGYNTSSTSIRIHFDDISDIEWAGIIGNFRLIIQSIIDPSDKNITNITRNGNEKKFTYDAEDLKHFTDYKIEVACFNFKGISELTNITVTTEESWALIYPPSLDVKAPDAHNMSITWEMPDVTKIPGIVRGFTVRVQAIYEEDDVTIGTYTTERQRRSVHNSICDISDQLCTGLPLEMENITITIDESLSLNTSGFRGNTVYNISISVDTKFVGLASPPVQITTPEGTPSMSAFNFTCETLGYSSLLLQWKHSPPAYLEGIRTQYMIYYQLGNKIVNETQYPYKRKMEIFFLTANTDYIVWMTAFTKAGEGVRTDKLNCSTGETTPTAAPLNVTASSFHYPYASLIQWNHIPDDQWHGSKMGYTIFYERLSTGEVDAEIPIIINFTEVALTTSHVLTGLQLYSVYRIRIAARTNGGVGFRSDPVTFETCHVPQAKLMLNYVVYPPYVDEPKGNSLRPGGILMDLTEQMLLSCGHVCSSFNESIHISFNHIGVDSFSDIKSLKFNGTQLQIPRLDTGKFTPDYSHIVTATSPGFILLEVPDNPAEAAAKTEDGLLDGILSTLPIVALYFVLNWLFGAMFWLCEPTKVEHKGRGMSVAGIFEGLYLAVMTSTTVGYGDKIPETTRGRLYIVFWTLLGLVLTGIVTGSLSSSLSLASINSMKQSLPDDKVLALYGTSEYTYGQKKIKKFDKNVTYYTYEELLEPLKSQTVKYALLDRYVAEILKTNISDYGFGVNKAFDIPTDFGVAAYGEMEKLKVCGTKFAKANTDITSRAVTQLLKDLEEQAKKSDGNNSSNVATASTTEKSVDMISFQAPLYQKTLSIVLLMWLGFIILGLIYEVFRRRKLNILKNKIYTQRELELFWQKELREFVKETLQEFQELMERMDEKINKLDYKHGKELLKLRTELSKLYGVNFKFVKPSELGLPLEMILEYKNDAKNRPKEPLSVRLRRKRVAITSTFSRLFRFLKGK